MQFTIVTILSALAATVVAMPAEAAGGSAHVIFHGATPSAQFTQNFRTNGRYQSISNPLSISKITVQGGTSCTFRGIDNSVTTVASGQTADVGPPQTQVSGACH